MATEHGNQNLDESGLARTNSGSLGGSAPGISPGVGSSPFAGRRRWPPAERNKNRTG